MALVIAVVSAFILLLLLLFLFLKIDFTVSVLNGQITVNAGFLTIYRSGLKRNDRDLKSAEKEEKFEKKYKNGKQFINFFRKILDDKNDDLLNILSHIKKTVSVKRLDIALEYGFSEAAVTGVAGGLIWSAISAVSSYLNRYFDIKSFTNIAVKPNYSKEVFEFKLFFKSRVRLFHLACTVRYILRFKDTLKGGKYHGSV